MRVQLLSLSVLLVTCAAPDARDVSPSPLEFRASEAPRQPDFVADAALQSGAGTYLLELDPPVAAMPDNESFRFEVRVADTRTRQPATDVTLAVDATMPEHGHGMNRVPRVSRLADGRFAVEGMYFHMTGRWELYLDVTYGAWTERAQFRVELSDE